MTTNLRRVRSFEKNLIGAETAEKECLEKLDAKYNGRSLLHRGRPQ